MKPDKVADRIAGAIVDLAYSKKENPIVACEVLIGHGKATIINETDTHIELKEVRRIVKRITQTKDIKVEYLEVKQDEHLNHNQEDEIRCGDNGIFRGALVTKEQALLTYLAGIIYKNHPSDGKYLIDGKRITICQSNATETSIVREIEEANILSKKAINILYINPLGYWTGGTNVDTGATNRKLGSDLGDGVTGGGIHGKDLSKADVTINIWLFIKAQKFPLNMETSCSIGDIFIEDPFKEEKVKYKDIVEIVRGYIKGIGGFEKLAEWGLIRPECIRVEDYK